MVYINIISSETTCYNLSSINTPMGIMWLANRLCILLSPLVLALIHHPTLAQPANRSASISDAQKSKRSLLEAFALANSPSLSSAVAGNPLASQIDWRFSLGNQNKSQVDFALQTPKPDKRDNFRDKASWRPEVTVIGDNLAVNISWPSRNNLQYQLSHYRIQFRYRDPHERRWVRPFVVVQTQLSGSVPEPYMYVTNKQPGGLEAGKVYQFQVVAVYVDAKASEEKSRWSSTVSFDYISPEPPLFRVARRLVGKQLSTWNSRGVAPASFLGYSFFLNLVYRDEVFKPDGTVHIKWSRPWRHSDFKITRFIILFRKEKRLPGGETAFHGFQHITAPGNLEEYKVTGLERDTGYQFVVYGENTPEGVDPATSLFTGGLNGRRITAFSQEVFVPMDARAAAAREPINDGRTSFTRNSNSQPGLLDMNTNASNSLMFTILFVLAGVMLTVMIFLVAICLFRQRKEKLRLLTQVNAGDKAAASSACVWCAVPYETSEICRHESEKRAGSVSRLVMLPYPVMPFVFASSVRSSEAVCACVTLFTARDASHMGFNRDDLWAAPGV
ncbi:hypothetical protein Aperf_G00000068081 [Anoplocephala perfoliata]